ncbi:MAG TPA: GNAT family N-acetyltransferase [Sphingomicrobium sp.]|jgi:RimJ/RimL family protein N-acetyltransferase
MAEIVAETERLRLRTWDRKDLDEFIRHTNTEGVMRWLGGVWPREKHEAAFGRIERYQRDFGHTFWIVERKSDGALLGFCGLKRVNSEGAPNPGDFEVGWRLREDAWGHGYAKEAAIASLDLAFERFGAPNVVALTVRQNEASQGLMKRLRMNRREDMDFQSTDMPPELNPVITYRIDADEWPGARAAALS